MRQARRPLRVACFPVNIRLHQAGGYGVDANPFLGDLACEANR